MEQLAAIRDSGSVMSPSSGEKSFATPMSSPTGPVRTSRPHGCGRRHAATLDRPDCDWSDDELSVRRLVPEESFCSPVAQQITKDPFTLDFLAIDSDASERQLEERLTNRIVQTLRELGRGFAFVGRQIHFDIDGDDFYVDLLFFHAEQLRYVVIELKTTKFDPRDAGQLGFYVSLVDDRLRINDLHRPTVGMLRVADKNETVVRYVLAGTRQPVAVSRYELSAADAAALPSEETLTQIATEAVQRSEPND